MHFLILLISILLCIKVSQCSISSEPLSTKKKSAQTPGKIDIQNITVNSYFSKEEGVGPENNEEPEKLQELIYNQILMKLQNDIKSYNMKNTASRVLEKPFVTVTYAQSLDGSISRADRSQVNLSGFESLIMTHGMRSIHDAILIGSGTAINDKPKLNVRHWKGNDIKSPQIVILDPNLKSLGSLELESSAIIFTTQNNKGKDSCWQYTDHKKGEIKHTIIECKSTETGHCDLTDCLRILHMKGYQSVMVEGGGAIISSFVNAQLIDRLIITIAPKYVFGYTPFQTSSASRTGIQQIKDVEYVQLGEDMVMVGTL